MAELLSKANLFSYFNQDQHNKSSISVFPKSCAGSCSMKLRSQALRLSSPLTSDFHGHGVVFQENKAIPKRGSSSKFSISAQVGIKNIIFFFQFMNLESFCFCRYAFLRYYFVTYLLCFLDDKVYLLWFMIDLLF